MGLFKKIGDTLNERSQRIAKEKQEAKDRLRQEEEEARKNAKLLDEWLEDEFGDELQNWEGYDDYADEKRERQKKAQEVQEMKAMFKRNAQKREEDQAAGLKLLATKRPVMSFAITNVGEYNDYHSYWDLDEADIGCHIYIEEELQYGSEDRNAYVAYICDGLYGDQDFGEVSEETFNEIYGKIGSDISNTYKESERFCMVIADIKTGTLWDRAQVQIFDIK